MDIPWDRIQVKISPMSCGRVRCEREWRLPQGWSDRLHDFDFWLVWAGRGKMLLNSGEVDLRPGVCLWMRPGHRYVAEHDPEDRLGVTFIHFDLIDPNAPRRVLTNRLTPNAEVFHFEDIVYVDALARRIQTLVRLADVREQGGSMREEGGSNTNGKRHRHVVSPALATAQTLLAGLLRDMDHGMFQSQGPSSRGGTPRRHHEAMSLLASAMSENPGQIATVAELARQAGYSVDHFTRVFTSVIGTSPQSYALQCKMTRAKMLLRESGLTVKEVADALGYNDIFFFSRQFRAKTGMTPTQYRQGGSTPGTRQSTRHRPF